MGYYLEFRKGFRLRFPLMGYLMEKQKSMQKEKKTDSCLEFPQKGSRLVTEKGLQKASLRTAILMESQKAIPKGCLQRGLHLVFAKVTLKVYPRWENVMVILMVYPRKEMHLVSVMDYHLVYLRMANRLVFVKDCQMG